MSVFQRGGNYLQRHLPKLYLDIKPSCETATEASKHTADDSPGLEAFRPDFRVQKDRLLAWALQWSDATAISPPDGEIDQKLDQAGLGQDVAKVMSDIQKLLVESETIQNPQLAVADKRSAELTARKAANPDPGDLKVDDTARSRSLLLELTTCIDSLYQLSESRRNNGASSRTEKAPKGQCPSEEKEPANIISNTGSHPIESESLAAGDWKHDLENIRQHKLFIDSSSIILVVDKAANSEMPPPYEEVMPHEKTRRLARLLVAGLSEKQLSIFKRHGTDQYFVLIENAPLVSKGSDSMAGQFSDALSFVSGLLEHQRHASVSYDGTLHVIGYTVDIVNARHGFVFAVPKDGIKQSVNYQIPILSNLRAIIPSKREDSDISSPGLEDRFRLGFNLLLSLLHFWPDRGHCFNLNSTNVVIFLSRRTGAKALARSGLASSDVRRPYLVHSSHSNQSLSVATDSPYVGLYKHADDNHCDVPSRPWAFDIYSLGLVLLEIGLWVPLSRLWKPKYTRSTFTSRVKSIYVPKLASKCGVAYMKVVQSCLDAPGLLSGDLDGLAPRDRYRPWNSYLIQVGRLLSRCCSIDICGPRCEPDLEYLERTNNKAAPPALLPVMEHFRALALGFSSSPATNIAASTVPSSADDLTAQRARLPESRSTSQAAIRKWKDIDIPQERLDQWNMYLMPKISKLLQKALDSSKDSCSASVMMVGKTPETAKTTICIQCSSVDKVRDCFKRDFRCKEGWGLVIMKGDVRRSGKARRKARGQKGCMVATVQPSEPSNQTYQKRPRFGASIGAFRDNEHLPPVSFGGAVLVDGKPYGMTVHHMLDAPSDDEGDEEEEDEERVHEGQRTSAAEVSFNAWLSEANPEHPVPTCDQDLPEISELSDDESEGSTIRPDYIDFESGNGGFWFAEDDDDDEGTAPVLDDDLGSESDSDGSSEPDDDNEDDRISVGDVAGIDPLDDEEIFVTQPAIDDVDDDFFPCIEDRDDDHLASHSLGYVHASSGIRRVVTGAIKHEVDWALIKVHNDRQVIHNTIQQQVTNVKTRRSARGRKAIATDAAPRPSANNDVAANVTRLTGVAASSTLSRLPVHCHARTSGLQSGRISPALALIKLHGRTSFSSSWVVEGGDFGVPGDSGAWIYDPTTGRVCGHVLAWGSQSRTAYMAPMEVLFEDIKRRLGAERVELPGTAQIEATETPESTAMLHSNAQNPSVCCSSPSSSHPLPAPEVDSAAANKGMRIDSDPLIARMTNTADTAQPRHQASASSMTTIQSTATASSASSLYSTPSLVSGGRNGKSTSQDPTATSIPMPYNVPPQISRVQVPITEQRRLPAQILPT